LTSSRPTGVSTAHSCNQSSSGIPVYPHRG
jgi:hypothetical protein